MNPKRDNFVKGKFRVARLNQNLCLVGSYPPLYESPIHLKSTYILIYHICLNNLPKT